MKIVPVCRSTTCSLDHLHLHLHLHAGTRDLGGPSTSNLCRASRLKAVSVRIYGAVDGVVRVLETRKNTTN